MDSNNNHVHSHECKEEHKESPIEVFRLGDDGHPVNPDDEVIEYIGARICALEGLENCKNLKKLLLRRNVIKKIENILHLDQLEEFELYDNQIKSIEGLEGLKNLKYLDISYNLIKKV